MQLITSSNLPDDGPIADGQMPDPAIADGSETEYEIILRQPARTAKLAEMTAGEIQALIAFLEEEMREREWDRRWDETLASEESQAYWEARIPELEEERKSGEMTKYVRGKSLAELFQQKV